MDALLGCPLHMLPDPSDSDSDAAAADGGRSAGAPAAARALVDFHAANWFAEVLGAFAGQADADMRAKAVRRANQLWALLSRLDAALRRPAAADLPLPDLNADADPDAARAAPPAGRPGRPAGRGPGGKENVGPAVVGPGKGKGAKKGRKGGKKAAADADAADGAGSDDAGPSPGEPDGGGGAAGGKGGKAASGGFQSKTRVQQAAAAGFATDLPAVRARQSCFRELSPNVLLVD